MQPKKTCDNSWTEVGGGETT